MSKIKFITVETNKNEYERNLVESGKLFGIDVEVIGRGEEWIATFSKLLLLREYISNTNEEYICFTDSRDVYYINNEESIWNTYKENFFGKIVFNSETFCWPDIELEHKYPHPDKKYRFLNSGCYIGPTELVKSMLSDAITFHKKYRETDDQLILQHLFLFGKQRSNIMLDYDCKIFQTLFEGIIDEERNTIQNAFFIKRKNQDVEYSRDGVYNKRTKTYPSIIHGNGFYPMYDTFNMLSLKYDTSSFDKSVITKEYPSDK